MCDGSAMDRNVYYDGEEGSCSEAEVCQFF